MRPIWLVGGTSEAATIAALLAADARDYLATVTTSRATGRYRDIEGRVEVVILTEPMAIAWGGDRQIAAIVDASHPFATQISQVAIAVARHLDIPYLRYERPAVRLAPETLVLRDVDEVLQSQFLAARRVLLTTGIKTLPLFRDWHERSRLYARILPTRASREAAIAAGFPPERTIAQQLPLERQSELDLWRSLQIETTIAKATGVEGGLDVKQAVARELGVMLIAIARPIVHYPQQTSQLEDVLTFCEQVRQ
ncbi:MAG: cobalt-precorrin-6A reductase [Cyanobacteria bacterium J06648_11]